MKTRMGLVLGLLLVAVIVRADSQNAGAADNGVTMSCNLRTCTFQSVVASGRACSWTVKLRLVSGNPEDFNGSVALMEKGHAARDYRSGFSAGDSIKSVTLSCSGP